MIDQSQAEAYMMDDILLYTGRANTPNPSKYKIIGSMLSVEPYSIMFAKDEARLKILVDKELVRMMQSGEFAKIYDNWFTHLLPQSQMNLNIPMGFLLRDYVHNPTAKANFMEP